MKKLVFLIVMALAAQMVIATEIHNQKYQKEYARQHKRMQEFGLKGEALSRETLRHTELVLYPD